MAISVRALVASLALVACGGSGDTLFAKGNASGGGTDGVAGQAGTSGGGSSGSTSATGGQSSGGSSASGGQISSGGNSQGGATSTGGGTSADGSAGGTDGGAVDGSTDASGGGANGGSGGAAGAGGRGTGGRSGTGGNGNGGKGGAGGAGTGGKGGAPADGGSLQPTPGVIVCAGNPCTIAGTPTNVCCAGGLTPACLPSFPGCVQFGISYACDDAADCTNGNICCRSTLGASCAKACSTAQVQLCRTNAECVSGQCLPLAQAREYSTCQ